MPGLKIDTSDDKCGETALALYYDEGSQTR